MAASSPLDTVVNLKIPQEVEAVCAVFQKAGFRAWLVGGCVRDLLLEKSVKDWDIATSAKPEETQQLFRRVIPTGIDHGTVTVLRDGQAYEVTTLRGDGPYLDGRRPETVAFVDDIDLDLARRDFTVNAMAMDPLENRLIDPYGGLQDLEARLLRAVGDPLARFQEDGLRPLRGARFCAVLEGTLEPETLAAIPQTLEVVSKVSHERIRDEWVKSLAAKEPSRAFRVMGESGLLSVCCEPLETIRNQPWPGGSTSRWDVALTCLDTVRAKDLPPWAMWGALFHGVGARLRDAAPVAEQWLLDYRFPNRDQRDVASCLATCLWETGNVPSQASARRWLAGVGRERAADMLTFHQALLEGYRACAVAPLGSVTRDEAETILAQQSTHVLRALQDGDPLYAKELAVDGARLMEALSLPPGPELGRTLRWLLEQVLEDPTQNREEVLLQLAKGRTP